MRETAPIIVRAKTVPYNVAAIVHKMLTGDEKLIESFTLHIESDI